MYDLELEVLRYTPLSTQCSFSRVFKKAKVIGMLEPGLLLRVRPSVPGSGNGGFMFSAWKLLEKYLTQVLKDQPQKSTVT